MATITVSQYLDSTATRTAGEAFAIGNGAAFSATSEVPADLVGAGMATYTARIEWLSADELLVLLDVFDNKD